MSWGSILYSTVEDGVKPATEGERAAHVGMGGPGDTRGRESSWHRCGADAKALKAGRRQCGGDFESDEAEAEGRVATGGGQRSTGREGGAEGGTEDSAGEVIHETSSTRTMTSSAAAPDAAERDSGSAEPKRSCFACPPRTSGIAAEGRTPRARNSSHRTTARASERGERGGGQPAGKGVETGVEGSDITTKPGVRSGGRKASATHLGRARRTALWRRERIFRSYLLGYSWHDPDLGSCSH